ncbi:sugar ABC transporter permease [Faecalibacterium sp. An122]|uniref:carbohydrate ABC transporter permease n=1 Tax=Faecalibacterium sp. An122 TaxID=1965551 RepID=UPI000B37F7F7|nr:sugar ABC transporter permease [Faecalibacterium sp. An122]OUQ35982.1 sugar ABC transporter permease [Faecalibacterium sp. An122]
MPKATKEVAPGTAAIQFDTRPSKRKLQEWRQGYLFLLPAVVILGIFIGIAAIFVVYLSFHKVNLFTDSYTFVGLENYLRLFTDETARKALTNTLSFSVVVVPCQTIIALIIASVLNSKIRGKYFFRTVYFLPTLTSSSALTIIFMFMFSVTGPINMMLIRAGILPAGGGINFLEDPSFALKVIMVMNVWSTVPQYTTMYLASLQDLPVSLYEAAEIDGANTLQKFTNITVPYLKPITTYVLLTGIIGTLQMFDQAYIFSNGSGGPANSTLTVSLMVYRYAFGTTNAMGYAACIAIILALVIMAVSMIAEKLNSAERWY